MDAILPWAPESPLRDTNPPLCCRLRAMDARTRDGEEVKVLAHSPGRYPILVVELAPGELRSSYYEAGYDLQRAMPVTEDWMRDNAIGRRSFVEVSPPREMPASALRDFVRRELLENG